MSTPAHFVRLQRLTGPLTAAPDAPADELGRFERTLARHLRDHPDLTIRGNRLPHEGPTLSRMRRTPSPNASALWRRSWLASRQGRRPRPRRSCSGARPRSARTSSATRCPSGEPGWRRRRATGPSSTTTASRLVRSLPADQADQRVPRRRLHPRVAGADLGNDHGPSVVSHRSRQRVDCVEPHRAGGGVAGLLHRPEDHGRVARSLAGRRGVGRQHHHPGIGNRIPPSGSGSGRGSSRTAGRWHRRGGGGRSAAGDLRSGVPAARQHRRAAGTPRARSLAARWTFEHVRPAADLAPAHRSGPGSVLGDHPHERPGSLRDRLVEVGALHGGRTRADRSRDDGVAAARREDRPAHGRRRGGHRRSLRDDGEGALDDVAGPRALQDDASPSGRDRGARPRDA